MSEPRDLVGLLACGCCADAPHTCELPHERPAKPALTERVGVYGSFLAGMISRITQWPIEAETRGDSPSERPLAARLTTRSLADPALAMMSGTAVVADVLTFYQLRAANEGFLRTAVERRSVLELARAIGYELSPGVSATAYLAFSMAEVPGVPRTARVPSGTQVQSMPSEDGELPQTFETSADFTAYRERNAVPLRTEAGQSVSSATTVIYTEPTQRLRRGDLLVVVEDGFAARVLSAELTEGNTRQRVVLSTSPADPADDYTSVDVPPVALAHHHDLIDELALTRANVESHLFSDPCSEEQFQAFLSMVSWDEEEVLTHIDALRDASIAPAGTLIRFNARTGFFGSQAPRYGALTDNPWSGSTWENLTIWKDPASSDLTTPDDYDTADVFLDREVDDIAEGSYALIRGGGDQELYEIDEVVTESRTGFGMSGKLTGLTFASGPDTPAFHFRRATAFVASEVVGLDTVPVNRNPLAGEVSLTLSRMIVGLQVGQPAIIVGLDPDTPTVERKEVVHIREIVHQGGFTTLTFEHELQNDYLRSSVAVQLNVATATHGERVDQVLGSGDASAVHQTFSLNRTPLTHVPSNSATGTESTLALRVNGVEWMEAASLYRLAPDAEQFVSRIADDGKVTVTTGDNLMGARLPTGIENVTATYRAGTGLAGMVGADSLTLLRTRPFGIQSVTNPLAAEGAQDPASIEDAKINAPLTVKTLDYIVSLQDYEDFAQAYAGIGKAQASTIWDGHEQLVFVTVASASGEEVGDDLRERLFDSIERARDPRKRVEVESYKRLHFTLHAGVHVDSRYLWADVEPRLRARLEDYFAFERRAFAQPVTTAEIAHVAHQEDGVVAVDIDVLARIHDSGAIIGPTLRNVLGARPARWDDLVQRARPAQLLVLHPSALQLWEIEA